MNWHYLLWIPVTVVYNTLVCWFAVRYNAKYFLKTYLSMTIVGLIPTWSLAAYYSKNLIFDGLVFDSVLVMTSPIIFCFLGEGHTFAVWNWVGVGLVIAGLVLTRWNFGN